MGLKGNKEGKGLKIYSTIFKLEDVLHDASTCHQRIMTRTTKIGTGDKPRVAPGSGEGYPVRS